MKNSVLIDILALFWYNMYVVKGECKMMDILLIYAVMQLMSTAFGLAVIGIVRSLIEEKLQDKGYVLRNRNSLYKFNEKLGNFLKGFIPFYYAIKAVSLIQGKNPINRAAEEEIVSGNYITRDEQLDIYKEEEQKKFDPTIAHEPRIMFEKPERYKATKNNIENLYDTYETPIEYITKMDSDSIEEKLDITPYSNTGKVEKVLVSSEVTNQDISRAISELSVSELELLRRKITELEDIKSRNKSLSLEKNIA